MDIEKLEKSLMEAEGLRLNIYTDSLGFATIGFGHKIVGPTENFLYKNGITKEQAIEILKKDIEDVLPSLNAFDFLPHLNEVRQRVIAEMVFNMGLHGVAAFKNMAHDLMNGDYGKASKDMLDSEWAKQVHGRSLRLAQMMAKGIDV